MSTYLRYPHLHGDLVTFVAADDIWLAPVDGGRAWRLTDDGQPVRTPRFSPDGEHIAFISFRDGHPDAYLVSVADGGSSRRLTWWGAKNTLVLGWTRDGRVLVASHAGEKSLRDLVVKAVALDGTVERLRYGPVWGLASRDDGATALCTPGSRPPAHWKRYRGGTAPRLWFDRSGDGSWEKLLGDEPASLVDPMWLGDRLVFVSDRAAAPGTQGDEQANLWVFDDVLAENAATPRQLTHQGPEQGYVRDASTDGQRVIWHSRGDIWLLDDIDGDPRRVEIIVPGAAPEPRRAVPTKNLGRLLPDHGADASMLTWRGNAFWLTHREGPARALVADSGVRVREPAYLGQTGQAVVVSDAEGADCLEVHHLIGGDEPRRLASGALGRVLHMAADPAGERVATISHDGKIRLIDLTADDVQEVGHSTQGEALSPSFSPDGRYLLWSQPTVAQGELHRIMILDTSSDDPAVAMTSGTFHDHDPVFTRDGKYVVFLSERTFDPEYDRHEFALSFGGSTRPWLIPISAVEPSPFGPSAEGWRISSPEDDVDSGDEKTASNEVICPDLDAEGTEERAVPLPVSSGDYRNLAASRAGVLWIEKAGETGELGSRRAGVGGDPKPDTIRLWSFEKRAVETVVDAVDDYAVSGDGRRLVVRHKEAVTVTPADRKPQKDDDPAVVKVDLSRLRFDIEPRTEWAQMFDESARLMRDHFWREDMDGVDWDAVVQRWRPLVSTLASHDDLVDLLWETVGELNTSHAYVIPADEPGDKERRLGLLGADLSPGDDGWRIDRILPGESSEPDARSPLRAAGVDARPGDVVVAVDGAPVDLAFGPATRLVGAAGKPVELALRREGEDRRVVVVPLDDEEVLRYQDWVRSRRAYVEEGSDGRLGYVHIPDMMSTGWAQLHRDWRHATRREGLVVDVRYNRGGHTSQLVLARLTKRLVGWITARHYEEAMTYPDASPRGPVVLVANEFSGSDGDIVNAASQAVGLGPVVGVRTWGGVVGIDGRFDLVDGTGITQPRYAFWLQGMDWGVENHGVDPDIEVVHSPSDFFAENDPQLDRAMEEALSRLDDTPAQSPPPMPDPKVG